MTTDAMKGMYEAIVVPTVLYGSETRVMNASNVSHVEALEMRCLRSMCGFTKCDRLRNERIRQSTGGSNGIGRKD